MSETVNFDLRLPASTLRKLKARARKERRSLNECVQDALLTQMIRLATTPADFYEVTKVLLGCPRFATVQHWSQLLGPVGLGLGIVQVQP